MMLSIKIEKWTPADGLELEANALEVVKNSDNRIIVAGPGSGKTELLAQKASYLLQTNTCKYPYKILAISFKRDAAYNLKERVKIRCGNDLSRRFVSYTFDSFAKQIVDHFRRALPEEYLIPSEYEISLSDNSILDHYESEEADFRHTHQNKEIIKYHTASQLPLPIVSKEDIIRKNVWERILGAKVSKPSFPMIMRLADLIINKNKRIKEFLQKTYHYVFLDEFQDTTEIQYDFFKSCFLNSKTFFTAVGDDKQRIMLWAGAKKSIFDEFVSDTHAAKYPLKMNFRSAPRLVTLQNHLSKHLLGKEEQAIPSKKWSPQQGECFVWLFENPETEIGILFKTIKDWIDKGVLNQRDICILVKQQLLRYAGDLITYFNKNGLRARDESKLQDLLTNEVSIYIIHTLYFIFNKKAGESKKISFSFLSNLHTELEDEQLLKLDVSFSFFISELRKEYNPERLPEAKIKKIVDQIINFADVNRIRALYPHYKNIHFLNESITQVINELSVSVSLPDHILTRLDKLVGNDTIPVMTIHKSKGLEYHTVIFVGLEDKAFWSFEDQPDEDKCAFFVALSRAKERVIFTFSKQREGKYGTEIQSYKNIKILFDELKNSGVVKIEIKK